MRCFVLWLCRTLLLKEPRCLFSGALLSFSLSLSCSWSLCVFFAVGKLFVLWPPNSFLILNHSDAMMIIISIKNAAFSLVACPYSTTQIFDDGHHHAGNNPSALLSFKSKDKRKHHFRFFLRVFVRCSCALFSSSQKR